MSLIQIAQELREQNTPPLAVHTSGTVTYVVYGLRTLGGSADKTGYPVLRITEPSADQVYLDSGFLLESDRVAGANGSTPKANIKTDAVDALLLLTNVTY